MAFKGDIMSELFHKAVNPIIEGSVFRSLLNSFCRLNSKCDDFVISPFLKDVKMHFAIYLFPMQIRRLSCKKRG